MTLEKQYRTFHTPSYIGMDPLTVVHRFRDLGPGNLEIAALIAACFSYGQVENIIRLLDTLFSRIDGDLEAFVMNTTLKSKQDAFKKLKYRFNDGMDVALLFQVIRMAKQEYGMLGRLFSAGLSQEDTTMRNALDKFVSRLRQYAGLVSMNDHPGFAFLLPSPASGSACKRMCMFLRWMIRCDDGIDLGLWSGLVSTSMLVIPVDTHVASAARSLRLTLRKTVDWTMAEEITKALRAIDPEDPVRFDFSLCRAGMVRSRQGRQHAA